MNETGPRRSMTSKWPSSIRYGCWHYAHGFAVPASSSGAVILMSIKDRDWDRVVWDCELRFRKRRRV